MPKSKRKSFEHLISTKPLLCLCKTCNRLIWYALDEGMPVYCDTQPLTLIGEIALRISGKMTFNLLPHTGLWIRDDNGVKRKGTVLGEHEHRSGFVELEKQKCQIPIKKRVTDLSLPPF